MADSIGCAPGAILFLHLGIPVGQNMSRISVLASIMDRFRSKLSTWKVKSLSFGGRLTLIKPVPGLL